MNLRNFFAELTAQCLEDRKVLFPAWVVSRSPGSHEAVINVYDVAGKMIPCLFLPIRMVAGGQALIARRRALDGQQSICSIEHSCVRHAFRMHWNGSLR
jgi:hypothetical protein